MYKNIIYTSFLASLSVIGTELAYRFNSSHDVSSKNYIIQSNVVLVGIAIESFLSLLIMRFIKVMRTKMVKSIVVISLVITCICIIMRGRYGMFIVLNDNTSNLYNATSFLVCVLLVTWVPLWGFKKPRLTGEDLPSIPFTDAIRMRGENYGNHRDNNGAPVTRSADSYLGGEDEENLPSYNELPIPPAYTKINVPDFSVLQEAQSSRPYSDNIHFSNNSSNG